MLHQPWAACAADNQLCERRVNAKISERFEEGEAMDVGTTHSRFI